ncbi:MAG: LapA family protein [Pseudomonadota bacterium]|nr:LapA family protein [Pseudomonadota bacterium]
MVRLFGFLSLIVLVVFGLSFAVLNAEPVSLNYYFGYHDIPLSMVVVLSLAVGAVIGILVSMGMILRLKQQLGGLRRKLQTAEKRADQLHILPVKE